MVKKKVHGHKERKVYKMRDKLCTVEKLTETIEFNGDTVVEYLDDILSLEEDIIKGVQRFPYPNKKVILNTRIAVYDKYDQIITAKYSLGEDISEIIEVYAKLLELLDVIEYDEICYDSFYDLFALGILLETPIENLNKIIEMADKGKANNIIFDFLVESTNLKRNFKSDEFDDDNDEMIYSMIQLSFKDKEKADKDFCEYMKNEWWKKAYGTGYKKAHKEYGYVGFWNYNCAAIAKILEIEDSSLKEDNHYPYELAHYKKEMEFTPKPICYKEKEEIKYKQGIEINTELESIIPIQFHEISNQFLIDYEKLSPQMFWEKYDLESLWFTVDEYIKESEGNELKGMLLINYLVDNEYIVQLDWKEDLEDYEVENYWSEEKVKLISFDIDNDQMYYAYIPTSTDLKMLYEVKIKTV